MARKKSDLRQLHIRLSEEIIKKVDEIADDMGLNRTDCIKFLVKKAVDSTLASSAPCEERFLFRFARGSRGATTTPL